MFFRALFATLLLCSTAAFHISKNIYPVAQPLLFLYFISAGILILSVGYYLIFNIIKENPIFAYVQLGVDTCVVTLIIYVTGGFSSVFLFLYLVVIICTSMLLFRKGSMIMASLCSIQYGILVGLEYYGILHPIDMYNIAVDSYDLTHTLFKIVAMMAACFAVAFLSSLLAEQERKARQELFAMEDHVTRVERMAAIGEMAAGIAHEIKNPLASLSGSIQLLWEDADSDPNHNKLIQIIMRETDRLNTLVTEFLLFAKPKRGKVEKIQLDKALADIIDFFKKDRAHKERISVFGNLSAGICIEIDLGHLHQIIWNLLLNSAEAIKGTGNIDISMYPVKNTHVCIEISDTGCGISNENIKLIFDPFFTTKPRGTGLGLSIVHRILEPYSGRLAVKSEVGKGTVFTMHFGLAQK